MTMNRRSFMKSMIPLGAAPMLLNGIPVQSMASPLLTQLTCQEVNERILVLVQLHGGNDGLNTVIPVDQYSAYANYRPNLRIPDSGPRRYLTLDQANGLHPDMTGLKSLYDSGMVSILQDVGYDNFNRSHFKGTDLWLTGGDTTPAGQNIKSGWMGRYLDERFPNFPSAYPNPSMQDPIALEFGSRSISLAFHRDQGSPIGLAIGDDPTDFYNLVTGVGGALPGSVSSSHYGEMLQYIMDVQSGSNSYASRIYSAHNQGRNSSSAVYPTAYPRNAAYNPDNELGPQLQTIAKLIDGGLQTRVYMVRLTGFDTHSSQIIPGDATEGNHAALLYYLSESLKAFFDDLQARGNADKVMAITFSEFGRQVRENGSRGTDHGTLAPMFVVGKGVNGGVMGRTSNLNNITNNILHNKQYDYRQVFGTLLQDWLGASNDMITEAQFDSFTKVPLLSNNAIAPPTCYAAAFPVGLLEFDAVVENNSVVRLNWQTATETNNDFFEVQRSEDGVVFERLSQVDGAGNSTTLRTYNTLDPRPFQGISYYRLKQVDFDGTFTYSDIRTVMISPDAGTEVKVKAYPNPASDFVTLSINSSEPLDAELNIMNTAGQLLRHEPLRLQLGINEHRLNLSELIDGFYYIEILAQLPGTVEKKHLARFKQVVRH
jgi:uncharacterized protein (DUF1501 family)